ncbi:MAG: ABC transporter ATP-binding protein [Treponema sp.]|jgi:lipopolysaccharide transport system ATP-binding protein|nr:ABC transporter ATP-binding protein [Treponema sp.]
MSDIAVRVEHLSKMYRLGVINNGTLRQDLQTFFALKFGKEDPNSKIDEDKYSGDKDHFWALKDISFDIKQGDRIGIIGKNGAGKSTLLKILSRITAPTEGAIKIKGKVASLLEVGTGFHGELTGKENIYLNGAILGMKKRRIDQKLDEIIAFSGIEHHIDTPVKRYSSGMYVRLAFAVAAHLDSDILIADEVLAVGDAEFQKKALGKMNELSTGEGRTVLFVSHNTGNIQQLCNCGLILEKGKVQETSSDIKSLVSNYLRNVIHKDSLSTKWTNQGNMNDPYFTLLSMELQEENGETAGIAISVEKKYRVQIIFDVKEITPLLGIAILVFSDDNIVLISNGVDCGKHFKPQLGVNTLNFILPDNFFNIREYIISLAVDLHHIKWIIDPYLYDVSIKMNVNHSIQEISNPYCITSIKLNWYSEEK